MPDQTTEDSCRWQGRSGVNFVSLIGANTAVFSVIKALILNPPHFVEADRVVAIWRTAKDA